MRQNERCFLACVIRSYIFYFFKIIYLNLFNSFSIIFFYKKIPVILSSGHLSVLKRPKTTFSVPCTALNKFKQFTDKQLLLLKKCTFPARTLRHNQLNILQIGRTMQCNDHRKDHCCHKTTMSMSSIHAKVVSSRLANCH